MNLYDKVKASIKWKKSNSYCASRLGISISKYNEIKQEVFRGPVYKPAAGKVIEFKEDLDKGIAEIKGFASSEPRDPKEIIELLKIDTTKWKLSSYWNKETHNGWFISAMVTAVKREAKDYLVEAIHNFNPQYTQITELFVNDTYDRDCVGILSTQDLHFGKEGNTNIETHFKDAIKHLVHNAFKTHRMNKIVYVIGGDLLNMDTFFGTTTSGTPVDNSMRAQKAYIEAFDALHWSIGYIKQFCENIHVVYLPGNHDRLSSYHLAHALSKCFDPEDNSYYFDIEYAERKVVAYGNNFFAFEHGDVTKKNTPLVYATEFPVLWGRTIFRTCYTGHFHSKKTIEYVTENEHNGFAIKHLPSLCGPDYWHYYKKFTGAKRQAIIEIHDAEKGKVSEFVYTV